MTDRIQTPIERMLVLSGREGRAAQRVQVRIVAPARLQGVVQMIDYTPREIKALRKQGKADAERHLG